MPLAQLVAPAPENHNKTKHMILSSTLSPLIHAIPALDCNSKFSQRQNHTSPGAVSEVTAI